MNSSNNNWGIFEKHIKIWGDFLAALGLSPITFYENSKGEFFCRVSVRKMIVSTLTFIMSILICVSQILRKKNDLFSSGSAFIIGFINIISALVMTLHSASVIWTSKSYGAMFSKFLTFSRYLSVVRFRSIFATSLKYLFSYGVVYIVSLVADCYLYLQMGESISIHMFLTYMPGVYQLFSLWHFAIWCLWLKEYLWVINRYIEKHSRLFASRSSFSGTEFLRVNTVFPESLESELEVNVDTLRHIRRLYHEVYVMSKTLNSVFATRNLLMVAQNFFLGTTLIYCALNELFNSMNNNGSLNVFGVTDYILWSAMGFLIIYGVIGPCTKVYAEAQDTVVRVQELFTKSSEGELHLELHSFIMQLFHEQIIFSPYGFFKLNNQLILSVIGSVASYLVVLIQFRITLA